MGCVTLAAVDYPTSPLSRASYPRSSLMSAPSYIVITPARNEAATLGLTVASMAGQSVRPHRWVIVNDGSTDSTAEIIDTAAADFPWIRAVHRNDRGFRQQGGGVVETFLDGLHAVEGEPWQYLVKFDADLSFDPDYFQRCLQKFDQDPTLGIGGGMIVCEKDGKYICESPGDPSFHVRGATKIYTRRCWDAIGGLVQAPGWDTIDELKANMLGFTTRTFPDVPLRHHRETGSADGVWKDAVKNGHGCYVTGYHPLFMAAKCIRRLAHRPLLVRGVGQAWGFCRAYFKDVKQLTDPSLRAYIQKQQLNKLLLKPSLW